MFSEQSAVGSWKPAVATMRKVVLFLSIVGVCLPASLRAQAIPKFDGEAAMKLLRAQCDFGPRVPGTAAHAKTRDFLAATLRKYADEVTLQTFPYKSGGKTLSMTNIVARFGSPKTPGILLCAHWDTRPFADQESDPKKAKLPILGANDGASGVAVLLEAARHFKAVRPPVPVAIVLFDGEDWGRTTDTMFLGSRYYAKNPLPWKPAFGILFDMVGDANLEIPVEPASLRAADWVVRDFWQAAARAGSTAFKTHTGTPVYDDHILLIEKGIPCIDVIDFTYPHWHTLADTPDKCSADSLRQVGNALLQFIHTRTKAARSTGSEQAPIGAER